MLCAVVTRDKDAHLILHPYTITGHMYKLKLNYIHQFCNNCRKQTEPIIFPVFCHWRAFTALINFPTAVCKQQSHCRKEHVGLCCSVLAHAMHVLQHFPSRSSQGNWDYSASAGMSMHFICISLESGGFFNSLKTDTGSRGTVPCGWRAVFGLCPWRRWGQSLGTCVSKALAQQLHNLITHTWHYFTWI